MAEAEEPEEGLDSEVTRLRKELAAAENAAADWAAERRLAEERGKEREEVARQAEELRRELEEARAALAPLADEVEEAPSFDSKPSTDAELRDETVAAAHDSEDSTAAALGGSHQGPQSPTNQRTPEEQRGCLIVLLLLIGGVVALGIWGGNQDRDIGSSKTVGKVSAVTTKAPAAATTQARSGASSCSLENEVRDLVREWNRVSAELAATLFDDSTTRDQYLVVSKRVMPKLQRVVADLRDLKVCLPGAERKVFDPLSDAYNDKLSGYSAIEVAVRIDSGPAMEDAYNSLVDANARSIEIACEIARAVGQRLPGAEVC
jgi:hypothetical protein